jgi:transcriptional regulator with XRE-family HTH domain
VLTGSQLRAARGLLNLSVSELAERTGLALNTVKRAESTNGFPPITAANMKLLIGTLEAAGVLFIPADELGPGVRLKTPEPPAFEPRRRTPDRP